MKILQRWWFQGKCWSSKFKKYLPIFVDTFLLKGGLNQIIFLLWLRFLWVFVLTGLYFNFCWLPDLCSLSSSMSPFYGCWFIEYFFIGGELGEAFFNSFGNLLNDIWRVVRFDMNVLNYVVWLLVGSVSAVVQIKSEI